MRIGYLTCDESGDFGPYEQHAPYYLVALVLHDGSNDLQNRIQRLDEDIRLLGFPDHAIHTAPLIRREGIYLDWSTVARKQIFNKLFYFARDIPFTYHTLVVDKRQLSDQVQLTDWLSKRLSAFLLAHLEELLSYDKLVLYYDNGQIELTKILVSVLNATLSSIEYQKILPVHNRLTQVADLICALELLALKAERKALTRSELSFFNSKRDLFKHYLDYLKKKQI